MIRVKLVTLIGSYSSANNKKLYLWWSKLFGFTPFRSYDKSRKKLFTWTFYRQKYITILIRLNIQNLGYSTQLCRINQIKSWQNMAFSMLHLVKSLSIQSRPLQPDFLAYKKCPVLLRTSSILASFLATRIKCMKALRFILSLKDSEKYLIYIDHACCQMMAA